MSREDHFSIGEEDELDSPTIIRMQRGNPLSLSKEPSEEEIAFNSDLINSFAIDDDDKPTPAEVPLTMNARKPSLSRLDPLLTEDTKDKVHKIESVEPSISHPSISSEVASFVPSDDQNSFGDESAATEAKYSFKTRVLEFEKAIKDKVNFSSIAKLAFEGIPDSPGLRSLYWKLLLSYLPNDRKEWQPILSTKRKLYQEWIDELIVDPRKATERNDHPLSTENTSTWNLFFKDREIQDEIDKDVRRTLPHLHFFNHDKAAGSTEHYEALKRILFIYAKVNPGIRYVQGMNEILGPLYYVFAGDMDPIFHGHAEADTFFCFTNLMAEIRDNFCKSLDKSSIGIQGIIQKLNRLLQAKDPEVWESFEEKKLNPQFYSFRWLTLLLSQEFDLPDVLRLWDSLFADPFRFEFLDYVCCAMIVIVRERLLDGSFSDNLKLLQSYPAQDIHIILRKAIELQSDDYEIPPPRPKVQQPGTTRPASSSYGSAPKPQSSHPAFTILPPMVIPTNNRNSAIMEKDEDEKPYDRKLSLSNSDPDKFLKPPKPFDAESSDDDEPTTPKSHPLE